MYVCSMSISQMCVYIYYIPYRRHSSGTYGVSLSPPTPKTGPSNVSALRSHHLKNPIPRPPAPAMIVTTKLTITLINLMALITLGISLKTLDLDLVRLVSYCHHVAPPLTMTRITLITLIALIALGMPLMFRGPRRVRVGEVGSEIRCLRSECGEVWPMRSYLQVAPPLIALINPSNPSNPGISLMYMYMYMSV